MIDNPQILLSGWLSLMESFIFNLFSSIWIKVYYVTLCEFQLLGVISFSYTILRRLSNEKNNFNIYKM